MNINKILLPVDGSTYSDTAATMAIDMAQDNNATIVLLNVQTPIPTGFVDPHAGHLRKVLEKTVAGIMEHYRSRLEDAKVDYTEFALSGRVGEVIVNVSKDEKCDIIVMGSKGKSDFEGLILGSATHKVLHTTHLPVLVVK